MKKKSTSPVASISARASRRIAGWLAGDAKTPDAPVGPAREDLERNFDEILDGLMKRYPNQPSLCLWRVRESIAIRELDFQQPILDIGCGEGGMTETLFAGKELHGLDLNMKSLKTSKDRGLYKSVLKADVTKLPYRDNFFGSALVNCVAEHVDDPEELLREAFRVMKPGGIVALTVPSHLFAKYFAPSALKTRFSRGEAEGSFEYFCKVLHCLHMDDTEKWRGRFERAGWSDFSSRPIVEPEAMILFSALELLWMSPFPLYRPSRRAPGQIGWMVNRFLKGGRVETWKHFWEGYLSKFMAAMPDPPPVGAGWLLWAKKR